MIKTSAISDYDEALYGLNVSMEKNFRKLYDALRGTLPPGYPID